MENIGYTALAAVCLCVGGIFFGVAIVFLVQWVSSQSRQSAVLPASPTIPPPTTPLPPPSTPETRTPVADSPAAQTMLSSNPPRPPGGSWLVMTQGPSRGSTYLVDKPVITIGRDPGSDIVIDHPQVSRSHARLLWQADGVVLEDTGSSNGSYVNRNRVRGSVRLSNGDAIILGGVVSLTFYG
jgi:hypothetical protein